ncbi:MAG: PhzF family phenazine biosynthesis protein [Planctomycetes bacterium]|nr:PhzF family phenazine biosynthesis protein [Planctomycetota bacterium]MBI3833299.1 PhzF family phenazine biosynthesis protein [Planctomycetota bacterium]
MPKQYYVVDAFTSERFTGNPAAVVFDAHDLSDEVKQKIAVEFNLSETTFVLPSSSDAKGESDLQFRWFTPSTEVDLCGHATIGGVHALVESGRLPKPNSSALSTLRIETRSGILTASVEQIPGGAPAATMIWLDLPNPMLRTSGINRMDVAKALQIPIEVIEPGLPLMTTGDCDLIMAIRDVMALNKIQPNMSELGRLLSSRGLRGLCVTTTRTVTPSIQAQSRFFAPNVGIDEDAVTGSVHGSLGAYLAMHGLAPSEGDLFAMRCLQGKPGGRTGLINVLIQRGASNTWSARIGGAAITVMRGELQI